MTDITASADRATGVATAPARRWWLLAGLGLAQIMITLDATIMNIALPSAQADLGFSAASRSWVLTAYTVAFAGLLLLSGRLADRIGRRNVLIIGLVGFMVASAVGGAAPSFGVLIVARAVQGVFAALLAPAALAMVTTTFPGGPDRARAFGIFGAIGVAGASVGLVLGGVLTEYLSWRWAMYINILFAIPAILFAVLLAPRERSGSARISLPSTLTVSAGLVGVVYGFTNAGEHHWGDFWTVAPLVAGAVLLALFAVLQTRVVHPLLPLRVLNDRDRVGGLVGIFVGTASLFGVVLFSAYYLQGVLGWSALKTGLAFLPQPVALITAGVVLGPRLNRRFGPKVLMPTGLVLATLAVLWLTRLDPTSTYAADMLPAIVVLGFGLGLFFPISTALSTRGLLPEDAGVGSALVGTFQQVGGSIGVAVLNAVAASATAGYLTAHRPTAALPAEAAVHGYTTAFWISTAIFAVAALATAVLLRRKADESTS
ncbi:MFS transporter [Streptomyces sp. NPDC088387]|uniref:MFS transporter n=1 Tax=Streptomyces sp. NPDC088387 TaxID=3365859 RepID=UPI0037FA770B